MEAVELCLYILVRTEHYKLHFQYNIENIIFTTQGPERDKSHRYQGRLATSIRK